MDVPGIPRGSLGAAWDCPGWRSLGWPGSFVARGGVVDWPAAGCSVRAGGLPDSDVVPSLPAGDVVVRCAWPGFAALG